MERLPFPPNLDAGLVTCLILLNREIEELKKQIEELKKAQ